MDELKIINDVDDISGEVDFINEEILKNLKIGEEEYNGKNVCLYKVSDNIFQVKLKDNIVINITNEDKKQIISFKEAFSYITSKNKDNNNDYDNSINNKNSEDGQNTEVEEIKSNKKENILINYYYEGLCLFFKQQKNIIEKIKNPINKENEFDDFLILNKKWFNKFTKIFEKEEIYQNDNITLESINEITNVQGLGNNELSEKMEIFQKRKDNLNDANLFKVEYEDKKDKKENDIIYPKEFIIIEVKSFLNLLLNNFKLGLKDELENNIYKMILGEQFLYVQDNKNRNTYFACSNNNNIFYNVELVLKYNDDKTFLEELKNYIQNKNGLDYYLKERNINFNGNKTQKIFGKDKKEIGSIININYNEKPIVNENLVNDDKRANINEINNTNKENKAMIKEKDKNIISISEYIKALFLSLLEIEELKNSFLNKNLSLPKNDSLSNLLYNLISYYNNKKQNQKNSLLKIIDDIENKIKFLNKDISTNINFKYIIDFVLTTLDNELNNYKNEMEEFDYEDFDQSLVYRKFQYFYKNNSIIQNLFYYHLEINTLYSCCGLNKYICKLCKYINLDIDSKEKVSLNDLIHYWTNKQTTVENFVRCAI